MTPQLDPGVLGFNPLVSVALIALALALTAVAWLAWQAHIAPYDPREDAWTAEARARADRARVRVVGAVEETGAVADGAFREPWPVDRPFRWLDESKDGAA